MSRLIVAAVSAESRFVDVAGRLVLFVSVSRQDDGALGARGLSCSTFASPRRREASTASASRALRKRSGKARRPEAAGCYSLSIAFQGDARNSEQREWIEGEFYTFAMQVRFTAGGNQMHTADRPWSGSRASASSAAVAQLMEWLQPLSAFGLMLYDLVMHLDRHLVELVSRYDSWVYLILFVIIFAETGFVITPFLPGDSLLFAVGALAAVDTSDTLQPLTAFAAARRCSDPRQHAQLRDRLLPSARALSPGRCAC